MKNNNLKINTLGKMSLVKQSIITAVCIALCIVLPMAFHSIPQAGIIYCPMHIPVLIRGLICAPQYAAVWHFRCTSFKCAYRYATCCNASFNAG